jgi:phosphoglycolate phosphatase-like HAD superfamily hydrolase
MPLQNIDAILFELVGCVAEFGSEEFDAIASQVFGQSCSSRSGSQAYWNVLNLLETTDANGRRLNAQERSTVEGYEIQAVSRASAYEDVAPALSELNDLGVKLIISSSLSRIAVDHSLKTFFHGAPFFDVWNRDSAGGVKRVPMVKAITSRSMTAERVMFITDTADGLQTAKEIGVNAILMMNDPDEAMTLTAHNPAGGIVSFAELPDFVRFVAAEHARLR